MKRTGIAELPLHEGKAPRWLFERMVKLAKAITAVIIEEYGTSEFLRRLANPHWFQAFGCVLGFDWHSSGLTTVVMGALKEALSKENLGIVVCGGKGKVSLKTPEEIITHGEKLGLSTSTLSKLVYASKMSAKVDNTAIQAGYPLYHHTFIIAEDGRWAVVQQGMNVEDRTARRYHWLSEKVESFVVEPHTAIVGDVVKERVLDMTARSSEGCRKVSVDLVREHPRKLYRLVKSLRDPRQAALEKWVEVKPRRIDVLVMPRTINWEAVKRAYEIQPRNYEEFLAIEGVGPSTVRGLALISELIFGEPPSWRDPVKYSFAFGGKDGVPFPVRREDMDKATSILEQAIREAKIGEKEKMQALRRLKLLLSTT